MQLRNQGGPRRVRWSPSPGDGAPQLRDLPPVRSHIGNAGRLPRLSRRRRSFGSGAGGSAPISGHCVLSGVANVNQPNSTMSFWTTVYNGPTGAHVFGWSMTETKVGTVTYTP